MIKIEATPSSSSSNSNRGGFTVSTSKHNHREENHHERHQVKIVVLLVASLFVLSGTMDFQRNFKKTMMQGQQIHWGDGMGNGTVSGIGTGGSSSGNLEASSYQVTNATPSTATASTAGAPDLLDQNVTISINETTSIGVDSTVSFDEKEKEEDKKKNSSQNDGIKTDPVALPTSPPLLQNVTTEDRDPNSTASQETFRRYDGVVIATKIHGPHQQLLLDQSLCLLQAAYNRKVNYDIVVFYTEELLVEQMKVTESLVYPAKIIWAKDNKGLQEEIQALSPIRRTNFLKSCNTTNTTEINWFSNCPERIAYNWQAEFRSWHIWTHQALEPYSYMLWLDTDGFSTREWRVDPVEKMIENDLNILFMNFPQGRGRGREIHDRMFNSLNKTICHLGLKNGRLSAEYGDSVDSCPDAPIPMIHGFFHITNLDFYRRPDVLKFEGTNTKTGKFPIV